MSSVPAQLAGSVLLCSYVPSFIWQTNRKKAFRKFTHLISFFPKSYYRKRKSIIVDCKDSAGSWCKFVINKNTKVCSEHFTPEDFICGGGDPKAARCLPKKTAVPSLLPWNGVKVFRRTTCNSQKSNSEMQFQNVTQQYCKEEILTEACEINEEIRVEGVDYPDCDSTEYLQTRVAELSLQLTELQAKYEKS